MKIRLILFVFFILNSSLLFNQVSTSNLLDMNLVKSQNSLTTDNSLVFANQSQLQTIVASKNVVSINILYEIENSS